MIGRRGLMTAGLALAAVPRMAAAQGRVVRVVVPLPAGTSNDMIARLIVPNLGKLLGQSMIVDNRSGGNGTIGVQDVLRAAPDGMTVLCGSNSPLAANVAFVKNLPYDPRRHVTPIGGASLTNHVLMVRSDYPAKTMKEFVDHARANPGKVSVGYSTTSVQLQIASLAKMAELQLLAVPYRGSPQTLTDVMGGSLDATLTDPGNALAQVKDGQMRALAVSSMKRNPVTPDWPAIAETVPGFDFPSWNGFVGPLGMSAEVVNRMSTAIAETLRRPDVTDQLASIGTVPLIMSAAEFKSFIDTETTKWVRLAAEAEIVPQ